MPLSSFEEKSNNDRYMRAYCLMLNVDHCIYIESANDSVFWMKLTSNATDKKIKLIPIARESENQSDGKRELEKKYNSANKFGIVAIDSDYDYSAQSDSQISKTINSKKHIVQTFVYSKESIINHHSVIDDFISKAHLQTSIAFKAEEYLKDYSSRIFNLLSVFLYLKSIGKEVDHAELKKAISPEAPEITDDYKVENKNLDRLEVKANKLLAEMMKAVESEQEYQEFIENLKNKEINESNAYLYINGHTLEKSVTKPLVEALLKTFKRLELKEIEKVYSSKGSDVIKQKKKEASNTITNGMNIDTYLFTTNTPFNTHQANKVVESLKAAMT